MPKLLGEFLQEQQEPFAMEVYLLERGYLTCTNLNARRALCIKKRRYVVPNCSDFLKAVFSQLVTANNDPKLKNSANRRRKNVLMDDSKGRQENAAEDGFSSAGSTTSLNSCSESNVGDTHCAAADTRPLVRLGNLFVQEEVDADRKSKRRDDEDGEQLSPVSVLNETESNEDSPIHYKQYDSETAKGESSNSISQSKSKKPTHYSLHKMQELLGSNSRNQYVINKRILQEGKQLLIDCEREVIEKHRKREKSGEEIKKMLEAEELWKHVCESVLIWSQGSINEGNVVHLLHSDFLASEDEWNADFDQQKMEISVEVENIILEDVINEMVTS